MNKPVVFIIMLMLVLPVAALSNEASVTSGVWTEEGDSSDWTEGELVYLYEMNAEDISQYIRGKIFQEGSYSMASGIGEIIYFTPEGNEYFWFCNSMDAQSRIRAEYGVWKLKDGFLTTTALKFVEWVGGHFIAADGSTASRYTLVDYNEVLTEVNIKNWTNFHMFAFLLYDEPALGFYWAGAEYYYFPSCGGYEVIREDYNDYFLLFGK